MPPDDDWLMAELSRMRGAYEADVVSTESLFRWVDEWFCGTQDSPKTEVDRGNELAFGPNDG